MCDVFLCVVFFRVLLSEISKLFLSILDLAGQARSAAIYSNFKRRSRSLSDILFLEWNHNWVKTNFFEKSTRLYWLGWYILYRLYEFEQGFQVLLVVLLWLHQFGDNVVVYCLMMFLNLFWTSLSQLLMRIYVHWPLYQCSLSMDLYFISCW